MGEETGKGERMKKERIFFEIGGGVKIPLKFIKNKKRKFIAQCPPFFGKIKVDELFFDEFNELQRKTIIYHELWHKKNNLKFELKYRNKRPWLWLLFFINKPILHAQEFEADLNAFNMTSRKNTLEVLQKLKDLVDNRVIPKSHEKTHPKIEDRIKQIKEAKKREVKLVRK